MGVLFDVLLERVLALILPAYRRLNALAGGILDILVCAFERYGTGRGYQAAASMAYYFIFALFPLLLLIISVASSLLEDVGIQQIVSDWVAQTIPGSREVILANIDSVLAARGWMTVVGLISLLWSASGAFSALSFNVSLMWPRTDPGDVARHRIAGVGIVALLFAIIVVSTVSGAVADTVIRYLTDQGLHKTAEASSLLWQIVSNLAPWVFRFVPFFVLYRWVPNTPVKATAAIAGAGFTTITWEVVTRSFVWFLQIGWIDYSVIYGSLGTIMALLFWLYLYSMVIFIGAALTSAIDSPTDRPLSKRGPVGTT